MLELPPGVPEPVSRPGIQWVGYLLVKSPNDPMAHRQIDPSLPTYAISEEEARYDLVRGWWSQQPQDARWRQMNAELNEYYYGSGFSRSGIYYKRRAQFEDAHPRGGYNVVYDASFANLIG